MRSFFTSRNFKIFITVLVLLLISCFIAVFAISKSAAATSAAGTALSPVQRAAVFITEKIGGVFAPFKSAEKLQSQLDEKDKQLEKYREQLVGYEEMKKKVSLYEETLDISEENPEYNLLGAAVTGRNPSDKFGSFTISKGQLSGVKVNDPVVYGKYLVGVVKSVKPNYSVVLGVTDPQVKISVYDIVSSDSGFITNTVEVASEGNSQIANLDRKSKMAVGDIICTTGIGEVYPRDLIIGEISEIRDNEDVISRSAIIKPYVDISKITNVFVVTDS